MDTMKKIVMLFLATVILAGASFAQATTSTDNGMKSDTTAAAPKKAKKAKKEKAPKAPKEKKAKKAKKDKAAATTDAPMAAPAK
jgi:uncharacterized iron-regulated membrane protein